MNPAEALLACIIGIFLGTFSGLSPGIHINTISFTLLLIPFSNNLFFVLIIAAMSITHSFVDFVPSILLGAPKSETSEAILPGHKLLMQGKGFYGVKLATMGCLLGLVAALAIIPFLAFAIARNLELIKASIPFVLIAALFLMLFSERDISGIFWSAVVISFSAILGILSFSSFSDSILPLTTGFFAGSSLIYSLSKESIPKMQKLSEDSYEKAQLKNSFIGAIAGSFVSIFPALGPSNAYMLTSKIFGRIKGESYLVIHGSINVSSMLFSFVTLYLISKARTGSAVAISNIVSIDLNSLLIILAACLFSGAIAFFIADFSARFFLDKLAAINYSLLNSFTLLFLIALVFFLCGFTGILLFLAASSIGLIANSSSTRRSNAMAFLIAPALVYYLI